MSARLRYGAMTVALALLVTLPLWMGNSYYINIASQILLFAVFALALNLLVGYAGLVSLGHAGLFAIAGYAGALMLRAGYGHLAADSTAIVIGDAGYLGVQIKNLNAATASRLGLTSESGALVVGVVPGSPAASTGMRGDSVITAIDGTAVTSVDSLGLAIHSHSPGEWIRVTWVDSSGTHTARATLVPGPAV